MNSVSPEYNCEPDELEPGRGASSGGAAVADGRCGDRAAAARADEGSPRHAGDGRRLGVARVPISVRVGGALSHGNHQ